MKRLALRPLAARLRSRPYRLIVACAVLASLGSLSPVAAQSDTRNLGPRSFFPKEYTAEYFVDFDALQDTELWDQIERSMIMGPTRTMFRTEFGFRLDEIRAVRSAWRFLREGESDTAEPREVGVTVIEGTEKLSLPGTNAQEEFKYLVRSKAKIAGLDVVREAPSEQFGAWAEARLYVIPKPGCLVIGSEEMIQTVLEGKRRGGVISSRLMALTAAKRRPIAYFAVGFPPPDDPRYLSQVGFEANWMDEDDPLQHMIARLEIDEKTERARLRATLRFKSGKTGPARFEEGVKARMAAMKREPFFVLLEPYLKGLEWRRDGEDLHVSLAVTKGHVGSLMSTSGLASYLFLMPMRAVAAVPAPVAAPAPAVKPAAKKQAAKKQAAKKPASQKSAPKKKDSKEKSTSRPGGAEKTKPTSRSSKKKKQRQ